MSKKQPYGNGRLRLSSYLGDRLHKALRLYLYETRLKRAGDPHDWINTLLDNHFTVLRTYLKVPKGKKAVVHGWSEDDIRRWVLAGVDWLRDYIAAEGITLYREEWSLDMTHLDKKGKIISNLGTPDFIALSARQKRWLVLDFKNAEDLSQYIEADGTMHGLDKLLGYAYGSRLKMKREEHRKMRYPLMVGYIIFLRKKVGADGKADIVVLSEPASAKRIEDWRRERVKRPHQPGT